ncbi:MAG: Fic family protein, partial [bacterium]|nr:Fic family protein [bacterium]
SAVEEIDVTEKEVEDIVKKGNKSKLLLNSPSHGILQAYGQKVALDRIEKWAREKNIITTNHLLELHNIIFVKIDPNAGRYREKFVKLKGSALQPSFPFALAADMRQFNDWLIKEQKVIDSEDVNQVILFISTLYHEITRIHPFADGNGRTGRLFVNLFLNRFGYPPILIPKVDNVKAMREALRKADMGDLSELVELNKQFLRKSYELRQS